MCKEHGMTVMELVITMSMIGILAVIAAPTVSHWVPNYRVKEAARELVSNLHKARTEAVRQSSDVIITFSPQAYTPNGGAGSYQVALDNNPRNGAFDEGEMILIDRTMPRNVSLYFADFAGGTTTGFNSRGLPLNNMWGSVQLRNNKSRFYRATMSCAGHVRLQRCSDGVNWN